MGKEDRGKTIILEKEKQQRKIKTKNVGKLWVGRVQKIIQIKYRT